MFLLVFLGTGFGNNLSDVFQEVDTIQADTLKAEALCDKAWELRKSDYALSSAILDSLEIMLDRGVINYDFIRPNIYLIRANSLGFLGREKEMFDYYDRAVNIYNSYLQHQDKQIRDTAIRKKSACYNNIAQAYLNSGQVKLAVDMYYKSLDAIRVLNSKEQLSIRYYNLGFAYLDFETHAGYLDSAEYYLTESYQIEIQRQDAEGLYWGNHGLGQLYLKKGECIKALDFFKKGLQVADSIEVFPWQMESFQYIGMCYLELKEYQEATNYYLRSIQIAENIDAKTSLVVLYVEVADLYKTRENYKLSNQYFEKHLKLKKELDANKSADQLAKFHAQFEVEKKQQQIELLKKDNEIAEKQKRIFMGGVLAAIVVILLVLNQFRIQRNSNRRLVEKNQTIRSQNQEIVMKNNQITDSIGYAKKIQRSILPAQSLFETTFKDYFIFYKPKDIVSGDFYWIYKTDDEIILSVADCTGHGVPGAFMSIIGSNLLDKVVKEEHIYRPDMIMNRLNELVNEKLRSKEDTTIKDGMDLMIVRLDRNTKKMQISGAYNPMYLVRQRELMEFKGDKLHLGDLEHTKGKQYGLTEMQLEEADCIYLLTDGYADQKGGEQGKKFYYPLLRDMLLDNASKPFEEQKNTLYQSFMTWKGTRNQIDDICIIGLKI